MFVKLVNIIKLVLDSGAAFDSAKQSAPFFGLEFGEFGRALGKKLLLKSPRLGLEYMTAPVNSVRYFEFPFVQSHVVAGPCQCLDISSPRLFSLYYADKNPDATVHIINPDIQDIQATKNIVNLLGYRNITTGNIDLKTVEASLKYDCIWSISVIEHISGDYDDSDAIQMMYALLIKGGKLILTFPVAKQFRDEYRANNAYGLPVDQRGEKYFFQRYYDYPSILSRLLKPIDASKFSMRWFGENHPGYFDYYESEWHKKGLQHLVNDPVAMPTNFSEFESWDAMPGVGVCGLMIEKD